MNASVNASAGGRAEGKMNAAQRRGRLPNAAYRAVDEILMNLEEKPCTIVVKVFGMRKGRARRIVEVCVDGRIYRCFWYNRETDDAYSALDEFLELLQKRARNTKSLTAKSLTTKTLEEILEENYYARVIELFFEDKPFVPTEELIRW